MHKNKQWIEYVQHFDILTSSRLAPSIEPFICASFSPISDTFGDLLRMRGHEHRRKSILTETELNLAVEQSLSVECLQSYSPLNDTQLWRLYQL